MHAPLSRRILHPRANPNLWTHARFSPDADLAPWVEHLWTVGWTLPEETPFVQTTLPDPAVHLVIEAGRSEVVGPMIGRFTRTLQGTGRVVAVKFAPGGFYSAIGHDVSQITDRRMPLSHWFSVDVPALEHAIFSAATEAAMAAVLQDFARTLPLAAPEDVAEIRAIVHSIRTDASLITVDDVARRAGLSPRALQRRFQRFVGLSPKWVLQRVRLQAAVEALLRPDTDPAELAHRLGYADQAHFIRAFRDVIGETPSAYARRNRLPT